MWVSTLYMNNTSSRTTSIFAKQAGNTRRFFLQKEILYLFPLVLQTLIWIPTRIILKFFLRFNIRGAENLKGLRGPVIFAVNHGSEWDPILVPAALPFLSPLAPTFFTSREREFYEKRGFLAFLYGGILFKIWGAYPVAVGVNDYEKSLKNHVDILEDRAGSICFFPEGAKTKDGNFLPAKGGISYLAHRTKTTVVPIMLHGHFKMRKSDFFLRRNKVTVTFGKPLLSRELFEERYYDPHEYKTIAQEIMEKIARLHDISTNAESTSSRVTFAFLVHPRNINDIYRKYPIAKFLPNLLVTLVLTFLPPVVLGRIRGLRSSNGMRHDGIIMSLTVTGDQILKDRKRAAKKIIVALARAKKYGARVVGLGSLTSPAVGGGVAIVGKHDMYVTNGNALTAAMTIAGIREVFKIKKLDLSRSTIAVIGATGSVGQAVSRILVRDENIAKLILVGKTPEHLNALQEKIDEIKNGSEIIITASMNDIKTADMVIVATSASGAIVQKEHLKQGAIVYDVTQPQNVPRSIQEERPDVLVIDGAIVELPPETGYRFDLGIPKGTAFACMAETMIMAAEDTLSDFSIGHVELHQVDHVVKRAAHHEFKLARLHSWGVPLK